MVRVHPDPPDPDFLAGAIAQLGERLLCKQEVIGSIPIGSTSFPPRFNGPCDVRCAHSSAMPIAWAHRRPRSLKI